MTLKTKKEIVDDLYPFHVNSKKNKTILYNIKYTNLLVWNITKKNKTKTKPKQKTKNNTIKLKKCYKNLNVSSHTTYKGIS